MLNKYLHIVLFKTLLIIPFFVYQVGCSQDIKFEHLNINNGLSQNTINAIIQDYKGIIWIGTKGGLNKFDGYNFVVYRKDARDLKTLSNNLVIALLEDKKHHIWVGTVTGLNLFDREKEIFKFYPSPSKNNYVVYSILEDKEGNLWIATDEGLKFLNPMEGVIKNVDLPEKKNVRIQSLYLDKNNYLWLGKSEGITFYDINKRTTVNLHPELQKLLEKFWIRAIKNTEDGSFWLTTEADGVIHYSKTKQITRYTKENGLLTNTVRDILVPNDTEVWIGTKSGLSVLNTNTNSLKNYTYHQDYETRKALSQSSIRTLFKDKKGNIWVGTYSGGINLVYNFKQNFQIKGHAIGDASKLSNKEVNGIFEDKDKTLWIATDGGGLNHWDRKTNTVTIYKYKEGYSLFNTIKSIYQDPFKDNKIWLGTGSGLLLFDKETHIFEEFKLIDNKVNPSGFIRDYVFRNSEKGIWIGSNFGGLYLFNQVERKKKYYSNLNKISNLNSNSISAIQENGNKGLWIGFEDSGLNYLDYETDKITSYVFDKNARNSISSNSIHCLYQDSKNRLWIGTDSGLNYFDRKSKFFYLLNISEEFVSNGIHAITEDNTGALWISTNKGISKLIIKENHYPFKPKDIEVINYTVEDGLQSNEFVDKSVFRSKDNELFFGGINGLTFFYPGRITVNKDKPNIIFTDFFILGKPTEIGENSILKKSIDLCEEITLPHNKAYFTIKFSYLNFIYPEKNKYAFVLEGLANDTWHYVNNQRQATYTNLDPGTYYFKVKAANNSGVWNDKERTLKIIILPPWYQTWWAYTLYAIIILLLLYLFIYFTKHNERLKNKIEYEKLIAKREQELAQKKLSFFINISHEIKTPITMIMAPLQKLLAMQNNNPGLLQYLNTMNKSGQRLLNLIDQLLNIRNLDVGETNLKAAKGNIVRFVKEIVVIATHLAKAKNINLSFFSSQKSIEVWFDRDKMEKVVYNILSNAIKYTPEYGTIKVEVELLDQDKSLAIIITDNGCGISEKKIETIFTPFKHHDSMLNNVSGTGVGLAFVKELIQLHHGEINVESTPASKDNFGFTCFTVKIPFDNAYLDVSEIDEEHLQTENVDNYKTYNLNSKRNFTQTKNDIKAKNGTEALSMLLVEDNEDVLNFLADHFKDDFQIIKASNGKIGYEKALDIIPDIIISDVMMPEMDGVEFCIKVKGNILTSHVPLILLTARSPLLFKLEGLENGADEYISKPFNLDLLEVKVWNLIGNRQKMRERFQKKVLLEPTNTIISSYDDKLIEQIIKYIEDNFTQESLNVEDLSAYIGMTRGNLYKKLKALTGKSPVEFIRYIRIKRSAQLLKQHRMYVNEVAYMVGFQDVSYFRKCFKEELGVTPTAFVKELKKPE